MIIFQSWITRRDLRKNPDVLYVFGDNLTRIGFGGQAREMRGEANAVGIPTKYSPTTLLDDSKHYDEAVKQMRIALKQIKNHLKKKKIVIFPMDGIGTGLAHLEVAAPKFNKKLQTNLDRLYEKYKG